MKKLLQKIPSVCPVFITFFTFLGGALLSNQLQLVQVAKIVIVFNIGAYSLSMFYAMWFLLCHADDPIYAGFKVVAALGVLLMGSMAVGDVLWIFEEYSDLKISLGLNMAWSVFEFFMAVFVALSIYVFQHQIAPWDGKDRRKK